MALKGALRYIQWICLKKITHKFFTSPWVRYWVWRALRTVHVSSTFFLYLILVSPQESHPSFLFLTPLTECYSLEKKYVFSFRPPISCFLWVILVPRLGLKLLDSSLGITVWLYNPNILNSLSNLISLYILSEWTNHVKVNFASWSQFLINDYNS